MKPDIDFLDDHYNPSVCCAKSCGSNCNDCYGDGAIHWDNCYRTDGHMCDQGEGGRSQCCATAIPHDRLCSKTVSAPCRLGTQKFNSTAVYLY